MTRALALALLVANLLVAAWLYTRPAPAPEPTPRLSASPLVLIHELPARVAVEAPAADAPGPAPEPAVPGECQGVGPFPDRDAVIAARDRLVSAGIPALPTAVDASQLLGYWVHTPPAASREAAAAIVDRLRRAGIRDFYLISDQEIGNAVSLGVFGQPEAAEQHAARLRGLGFEVQVGERRRPMTAWWLEFEAPVHGTAQAAALADIVLTLDGIRLERRPCPE